MDSTAMATGSVVRIRRQRAASFVATFMVLGLALVPSSAWADSASIDAVQDAGRGQITVTYTVSSTAVGQFGSTGWFAYLAEDHNTRACNATRANYLRDVKPFQDAAGSVTRTMTFRPLLPASDQAVRLPQQPGGRTSAC
jgi:hypothetical protein